MKKDKQRRHQNIGTAPTSASEYRHSSDIDTACRFKGLPHLLNIQSALSEALSEGGTAMWVDGGTAM